VRNDNTLSQQGRHDAEDHRADIQQYAYKTQNWTLLRLLDRFTDFHATAPIPPENRSARRSL